MGNTALHFSTQNAMASTISLLIDQYGSDVNVQNSVRIYVVSYNSISCQELISKYTLQSGYTPLHFAVGHGHKDIVVLLIETFGADFTIRSNVSQVE